jgi:predicted metal-dependent phosphoesterase TrpH
LYKVAPGGVDVAVTVDFKPNSGGTSTGVTGGIVGGFDAKSGWLAGALHVHSVHSDGRLTVEQIAELAEAAGLDFVALTDHNTTTVSRDWKTREHLSSLFGEEITTPGGHANALGLRQRGETWIDFRVAPGEANAAAKVQSLVDATHSAGGLFVINHPAAECDGCAWAHEVPSGVDGIEIWNGARDKGPQPRAMELWDRLLRSGRHVTAIGASDFHAPPTPIDQPTVRVHTPDRRSILSAIASGRVVVVRDARVPTPDVRASTGGEPVGPGDTIRTCSAPLRVEVTQTAIGGGRVEFIWNGERASSSPSGSSPVLFTRLCERGYARVHVYDANGEIVAVTNPIYVEPPR